MATDPRPLDPQDAVTLRVPADIQVSPDGTQVVFTLGWASKEGEHELADLWLAAHDGSSLRRLTSGAWKDAEPRWAPDGRAIAFISDREQRGTGALYLISPTGGEAQRISRGDAKLADPRWAPDGTRLTVKATDPETAEDKRRKEQRDDPMVRGENEKFDRLCVVPAPADPFGGGAFEPAEPARLLEGDWHVWEHAWAPDGSRIAVTVAPHPGFDETRSGLRAALLPASGGALTWIGGQDGVYRTPGSLAWSPDGQRLAFLAAFDLTADSGSGIFLVDTNRPETPTVRFQDEEGSPQSVGWRDADTLLMVRLRGVYANFWTLGANGGAPERATGGPIGERGHFGGALGSQVAGMAPIGGRGFAGSWTDATHPLEVWAGEFGGEARQLTQFNEALRERQLGRTEVVRWQADDGLEIEGLLLYPAGYVEGQRYPTILATHGGPSGAWDDHFYGTWHDWAQIMAGRGYAVLLPNPRGSTGRGWQFQRANTHDWMGGDYRDSQLGLDALIERGIADPERLGVGGWSYGGYTTAWTITQTGRFKAAIVGAGASNRTSASGTTDMLRWAQTWFKSEFAEDPDEYWRRSPVRYIAQTTTPTLILHGELDARVPTSQGVELYNQLRAIGATTQLVIYPREPHTIGERQHQRDLLERVIGWFDQWVKG